MAESCGFPRSARLLNAADYQSVFSNGVRVGDRYWTLIARQHDRPDSRLGLAIAKKRARRAVDRNSLKRLARESFRRHRHSLAGFDIVLLNRDAATGARKSILTRSLKDLWERLARRDGRART